MDRITFFIPTLEGGGSEKSIIRLIKALNEKNFSIVLLVANKKGELVEEIPENVEVEDLNVQKIRSAFFKLIKYFKSKKPDVFVSFLSHANVIAILAKIFSRAKTKIIVSERITFTFTPQITKNFKNKLLTIFFLNPLVKITYPLSDAIVCNSNGVAEDLSKFLRKKGKIKVIYNPVVSEKLFELAEEAVDHPWFLDKNIPIILAAGRLNKQKDYPTLLKAFSLVLKEKKARLVILGKGEERKKLENLIEKLNISDKVILLGFQKNPFKFMKRATIFVLSSKVEGFPNVLVEAMALGVPVVSTNCPSGPNEIIKNGENGFLVPVGDEKALAEAILRLLNDSSLKEKFSIESKKSIEKFRAERIIKEWEELFKEILIAKC